MGSPFGYTGAPAYARPPQPMLPTRASLVIFGLLVAPFATADEFFESRIRPVLVEHCYECHSESAGVIQAGLRLDAANKMREGGDSGSVIVPGDPEASLLIRSLRYEDIEMPPSGPLDEKIVRDFEAWVKKGAVDPRGDAAPSDQDNADGIDWDAAREFWSFRKPVEHPLPVRNPEWTAANWIDQFVQARLDAAGLKPNSPADRRTLIRRVTFDLTGLPPTADEVEDFVADPSPDAYERVVDRLLSSPQQGEHWTRLWLDVARYAEDQAHIVGKNDSLTYPNAYFYRDWAVSAFASDMPYDDFVRMQLAADVIAPDDRDAHLALGFLGLGPKYYRRGAPEVMADEWEDRIDTVTRGLLGLTVACARCHDHKYDPIETEDYYALAGVFAGTEMFNRPIDDTVKKKGPNAEKPQDAEHILREGKPRDLNVMIRGDVNRKGDVVPRRFLTVLSSSEPRKLDNGSGRVDLAEAIVDTGNPLTARVIVNRVWRQFTGAGFVETPSNFGVLGETPSHPELLDTLAVRFMREGWSLKWLQREIVLSATYQQGGGASEVAMQLDPANRLLWRMPARRLSIEAYRDAVLSAADRLERRIGGPSMEPHVADSTRRTLYSKISRLDLNPLLARFDFPDPNAHSAKRVETTTPLQKLFLMNSEFMNKSADTIARRTLDTAESLPSRIEFLYRELFGRRPSQSEVEWAESYVSTDDAEAWMRYAQVLLISNEMLFVD
ncbi:MAG: PSD1 and planctomycete cytochrome C domain-containing protein [Planctomycetota bacterium]